MSPVSYAVGDLVQWRGELAEVTQVRGESIALQTANGMTFLTTRARVDAERPVDMPADSA